MGEPIVLEHVAGDESAEWKRALAEAETLAEAEYRPVVIIERTPKTEEERERTIRGMCAAAEYMFGYADLMDALSAKGAISGDELEKYKSWRERCIREEAV